MVLDEKRFLTAELANITQMIEEHIRIALSANRIVANSMSEWLDSNSAVSEDTLRKITDLEEKGNEMKQRILSELASANSMMQREDLLRLVFLQDKLIDGAEIACYHLADVCESWSPDGELREHLKEISNQVLSIVTQQREAVRFLSINLETSLNYTNEICTIEKHIDIIQRKIIKLLYNANIGIAKILRARDMINTLEEISNFSEDAANTIRGLSLTLNI